MVLIEGALSRLGTFTRITVSPKQTALPPLLTGEIEETTGLHNALTCVMDVKISCGVLRVANGNFIGLMGIVSSEQIIGAVTKDENASKLTDMKAVDTLLAMRQGTFEFYEVPEKELSRLNQNLGLDIAELLIKYAPAVDDENAVVFAEEEPALATPVEDQAVVLPAVGLEEIVDEEPTHKETDIEEPVKTVQDNELPSELDDTEEPVPAVPDPPETQLLNDEEKLLEALDVSALDAIQAPSAKPAALASGSLLSKMKEKLPTSQVSAAPSPPVVDEPLDQVEAATGSPPPFDPSTDELQLNAAATIERIKKFRKPDSELEAEAERAQRLKFASSRKPKLSEEPVLAVDTEAERQRIRPAGKVQATESGKKRTKVPLSPKVKVAIGSVAALAVLFLISRGVIANYLISSAQVKFEKRDYSSALTTLSPVFFLDPSSPKLHTLQGEIAKAQGDRKKAFDQFQEALQAQPNDPDTLRAYIFAARKLGKYDLVKTATQTLMQNDPAAAVDGYWFGMLGQAKFNLSEFSSACGDYTQSLKLGLKTPWIYSGRAWAELYAGKPKLAIKDFDVALTFQKDDGRADALLGKGQALTQLNDLKGALSCYNLALQLNPKLSYGYLRRAGLYVMMNDSEKAFVDYEQALRVDPKLTAAHVGKAELYVRRSRLDLALKELKSVDGVDFERAALQIRANQFPQAIVSLKKGLETNSKDANKYMDLAYAYSRLNHPADAALACEKAMALEPKNSSFVAMHGFYNQQNGQNVSARADFEKALSLDPKNAEAHLWRGMLFAESKDMVSARQDFEQAARLKPSLSAALDALKRTDKKYLALSASARGSSQSRALPLISGDYKTLLAQGYAKLKSNQLAQAIQYLASAVKENPNSIDARRYLAYALASNGNLSDAITEYQELVNIGSSTVADQRALGELLLKVDRPLEAIDAFKRILVGDPHNTSARCLLANAYSASGNAAGGIEVCDVGKKIDPQATQIYSALAEKLKMGEGLQPKAKAPNTVSPQG